MFSGGGQILGLHWYHRTPSNPCLRSATSIQPAPSIPAPAAFCPCRRGHASSSPVIPRRVPEVDHEIPFICRALPLLFGFLAVCRRRGNQKSSVGAPCLWQTRSLMPISSATSSSNPSPTSNGCATGWRRGKERVPPLGENGSSPRRFGAELLLGTGLFVPGPPQNRATSRAMLGRSPDVSQPPLGVTPKLTESRQTLPVDTLGRA